MKSLLFSLFVLINTYPALAANGVATDTPAVAATDLPDAPNSLFDHIVDSQIQRVRLTVDMAAVQDNRRSVEKLDAIFHDGHMAYAVDVSVRGRFRRLKCAIPPLKLQFKKKVLRSQGLNTHNNFKLVTLCQDDEKGIESLKREQLAYELSALITGNSFRTRLLEITYVDSRTGAEDTQFGILIEDKDQMAERLGGKECKDCYNLPDEDFVPGSLATAHLFQYMIGNTDYDIRMDRNVKLVVLPSGQHIPVAYDFDFSGIVDASYARPNVNVGQTSVQQRVWMGQSITSAELAAAIAHFNTKKDAVYELVENRDYLDKKTKRAVKSYLKDFYRDINKTEFPNL